MATNLFDPDYYFNSNNWDNGKVLITNFEKGKKYYFKTWLSGNKISANLVLGDTDNSSTDTVKEFLINNGAVSNGIADFSVVKDHLIYLRVSNFSNVEQFKNNYQIMVSEDPITDFVPYEPPIENFKIMIRDGNSLFTISDGVLQEIQPLNPFEDTFLTHGISEIAPPNLLKNLSAPEILIYSENKVFDAQANMTAYPNNQSILTQEYDMGHESILGLSSMTADIDGFVSITITFDHNTTWWKFNGAEWVQTTQDTGMNTAEFNAITAEQWADLLTQVNGSLVYRLSLVIDETTAVRRIDVKYINP